MPAAGSKRLERRVRPKHHKNDVLKIKFSTKAKSSTKIKSESTNGNILPLPPAADLCLDHMLHDGIDHPLCKRNVEQILDSVCPTDWLGTQVRQPLTLLMDHIDAKDVDSLDKQTAVRRELLGGWATRMVTALGESMQEVLGLTGSRVKVELEDAKVELKFTPIVPVAETDAGESDQDKQDAAWPVGGAEDGGDEGHGSERQDEEYEPAHHTEYLAEETEVKPRISESVVGSGLGEEPPSPENSSEEFEGDHEVPAQNWHAQSRIQSSTAFLTMMPGCSVTYFPKVVHPALHLMLTEPDGIRSKRAGVNLTSNDIANALAAATPCLQKPRAWIYYGKIWLITYRSNGDASRALPQPVILRGKPAKLEWFRPIWTQTFICELLPSGFGIIATARDLLRMFPKQRFHLAWVPKPPGPLKATAPDTLVLIFERVCDINGFKVQSGAGNGPFPAAFMHITNNTPCYCYGRQHPLAECNRLTPLGLDANDGLGEAWGRLLYGPPSVKKGYASVN